MKNSFNVILRDISSLKVQGAENVSKTAVKAIKMVAKSSKGSSPVKIKSELRDAAKKLVGTRPTEPAMRNSLKYVLNNLNNHDSEKIKKEVYEKSNYVLQHFEEGQKKIVDYAEKKIKKDSVIFTHCHSSTVVSVLTMASKNGKNFTVCNTETRPLLQGRKTALELSKNNIAVKHYVDSAAMVAMKKADICIFGADSIQSDGRVVNKIGTGLFVELAIKHDIPVFFCMNSWKFDPLTIFGFDEPIELRPKKEVWNTRARNVDIKNPAFEFIEPQKITGIISEFGVYCPNIFGELTNKYYPWMRESIY